MLNSGIQAIFEKAYEQLILISPYIKLHDRLIASMKTKRNNHELKIVVVFGKNKDDISRSMKKEDLNFFMDFPNIEIRYEERLHAKYYANDFSAIITSMNLYSFSQNNNIEAGVLMNFSLLGSLDSDANEYFNRVIDQAELIYQRTPNYDKGFAGFGKTYKDSTVKLDRTNEYFSGKMTIVKQEKPNVSNSPSPKLASSGFCIRTGKEIPFDPKMPYCDEAYQSWLKYKNSDYKEKYCHFSGEASNGETSLNQPILRKNWQKAKEAYKF